MARRKEPDTFSDELRGASDSIIRRSERPGRRLGRGVIPLIIVFGAVLGIAIGGAYALWSSPESLTRFFGGGDDTGGDDTGGGETPSEAPEASDEGRTAGVDNPFAEVEEADTGINLGGGDPLPEPGPEPGPEPMPPTPEPVPPTPEPENPTPEPETPSPEPSPEPAGAKLVLTSADVSAGAGAGGGTKSRVVGKLSAVQECFDAAVGRGGGPTKGFTISFKLKWNGKPYGVSVGAGDSKFKSCARKAVGGSYPHPRASATSDPRIRASFRLEP